jgi:CHAT domain-containing protein
VIHIASHGRFSSQPEANVIAAHDRPINLRDFRKLLATAGDRPKSLELLVPSACATAYGDDQAGLGLAGIGVESRAQSTLASLWFVSDQATALFMETFYQAWVLEGKTKAQAWQQAFLAIKATYPDSRLFAPFILTAYGG